MEFPILGDLLVVFGVAALVVYAFSRLKIPAVVGLLVAGVVVLLFTVGLEFSLSRLLAMWREMLLVGLPMVLGSGLATAGIARVPLGAWGPAIFVGMLVAMSSTAVVMKVMADRGELGTPHGRMAVAVLLLQDLLVTVFMIAIPLLAPGPGDGASIWVSVAKGLGVVGFILVGSRFLVTPLLHRVVGTRNRELFLIFVFLLCIGTAVLTGWAGLSLALGAFLSGLTLSESEYAHQAFSEVLPFRDTLSSLFFVSVGMLLDVRFVAQNPLLVGGVVLAVLAIKFLATAIPTLAIGYPLRVAALTGAALLQVGEFSFVLAGRGMQLGLLRPDVYQAFLAAAVLTMVFTPFSIALAPRFSDWLAGMKALNRWAGGRRPEPIEEGLGAEGHVIIVGYGLSGQNLARVLRSVEIPYQILEMNPESVRRLHGEGEPIHYGDATRSSVLEHLGIGRARVLVVAISDPAATRRAVQVARTIAPHLHIVARTSFASEIDGLKALGADEIIPEDFVTSVEIFARVLREFDVPRNQIVDLIDRIRSGQYEALRGLQPARLNLLQQELASESELESCRVPEGSAALGQTVGELNLRAVTGATLVGVRRDGQLATNPDAAFRFRPGDVALLFGDRSQVDRASALLDPSWSQPEPHEGAG